MVGINMFLQRFTLVLLIEGRQNHHVQINLPPGARLAIFKNSELAAKQFLSDSRQPARLQSRQSAGKLRSLATTDRTDEQHDCKCG
jgi:hypothetical protein